MKRIIFLLASVLMLTAAMVGLSSCKAGEHLLESSPGLEYSENDDGTYTVTGIGSCTDKNIVIGMHNGKPVTAIGDWAFCNCSSLKSVRIGNSVTSIGERAFACCSNLTSVRIGNSVASIGTHAFHWCNSLTSITVDTNNTAYKSIDRNLYSKDGKTLIQYAPGKRNTRFTIPDSVTSIGYGAFYSCYNLTSIIIPDSVTSIGDDAFYWCTSLKSVTIGNSVTSIGDYAFFDCDSLTNITIPNSVTSIGNYAFYSCNSLTSITVDVNNTAYKSIDGNLYSKDGKTLIQYAPGKRNASFTTPDSVTSIGDDAFARCESLTSITIPDSVTSIGDYTFYDCVSLTDVYYTGTAAEWAQITIGKENSYLTSATIHYNYQPAE